MEIKGKTNPLWDQNHILIKITEGQIFLPGRGDCVGALGIWDFVGQQRELLGGKIFLQTYFLLSHAHASWWGPYYVGISVGSSVMLIPGLEPSCS